MQKYIDLEKQSLIESMQRFHHGQFDSQGAPYWLHPYRVALNSKQMSMRFGFDVDYMRVFTVGLFHDVPEDTDFPLEEIAQCFNNDQEILRDILLLTKPKIVRKKGLLEHSLVLQETKDLIQKSWDADIYKTYESWVECIIEFSPNAVAPIVKYNDNCDNSEFWRSRNPLSINKKYDVSKKILKEFLLSYVEVPSDQLELERM